jgi:hypothetical protein
MIDRLNTVHIHNINTPYTSHIQLNHNVNDEINHYPTLNAINLGTSDCTGDLFNRRKGFRSAFKPGDT